MTAVCHSLPSRGRADARGAGYVLNRLFLMIEHRVLAWHDGYTRQQRN
jgi:hypothetical protein